MLGKIPRGFTLFLCDIRPKAAVPLPLQVQSWAADDPEEDDFSYVQVTCLACAQAHLVNPKNGRVLGGEEDE
jgi:hypothetical protein